MTDFFIAPLGNHKPLIPVVAQWFREEWPGWYGKDGQGNAEQDLFDWCDETELPFARIAMTMTGEPVGIVALKPDGLGEEHGLTPFVSALLVVSSHRRQGVATALIEVLEQDAIDRNVLILYSTTDSAAGLLKRMGWQETGLLCASERGDLPVFSKDLRRLEQS